VPSVAAPAGAPPPPTAAIPAPPGPPLLGSLLELLCAQAPALIRIRLLEHLPRVLSAVGPNVSQKAADLLQLELSIPVRVNVQEDLVLLCRLGSRCCCVLRNLSLPCLHVLALLQPSPTAAISPSAAVPSVAAPAGAPPPPTAAIPAPPGPPLLGSLLELLCAQAPALIRIRLLEHLPRVLSAVGPNVSQKAADLLQLELSIPVCVNVQEDLVLPFSLLTTWCFLSMDMSVHLLFLPTKMP